MSPLQSLLNAGDRFDDAAAGTAVGLSLVTPVAQILGLETVPDMSLTSAGVLTALTLGRMAYSYFKAREDNRHQEAVIRLEIERAMAAMRPAPAAPPDAPDSGIPEKSEE